MILAANDKTVEGTSAAETPNALPSWQSAMKRAIRSGRELCRIHGVSPDDACSGAEEDFPVFVPLEYLSRMEKGNALDPLFRQVLAAKQETRPGGLQDPVGDHKAIRKPGLLHKYAGRVLLITTGVCGVHCRYCFRRNFPYEMAPRGKEQLSGVIREIAGDESITEVILSGGDPLTLVDETLEWLCAEIASIPHVRRLRFHTRMPTVIPQRVCDSLIDWVERLAKPAYFVLHFNHANEFDDRVAAALKNLRHAGASLLNQAVLLRGVNDELQTQVELCEALLDNAVIPYYLHQLDPVQGALHFSVSDRDARRIHRQLRERLPGYAVPRYVAERAGEKSKTPIA